MGRRGLQCPEFEGGIPSPYLRRKIVKKILALSLFAAVAAAPAMAGQESNYIATNGLTQNAITQNGLTQNGLTQNGLTQNAIASNSLTVNAAHDAVSVTGKSVRAISLPSGSRIALR
jgi:hypothetical protein